MKKVNHQIPPVFNKNSKILILGSFPSVKSREDNFYYAHPQNQFWKIMSDLFSEDIIDKKEFLLRHNIALWDVIASCEIVGSSDSSIKNVIVNDISFIVNNSNIKYIFTTGKKAYNLYNKYLEESVGIKAIYLPSTSPTYKLMTYEEKLKNYGQIKKFLN